MSTGTLSTPSADTPFSGLAAPSPAEPGGKTVPVHARSASLAELLPRLRAVFQDLDAPDSNLLEQLAEGIGSLQDGFIDALCTALASLGINVSENKLTLRLNNKAELVVYGEHPHKATLEAYLHNTPDLAEIFAEIAAQSAALRDLRSLHTISLYSNARDSYIAKTLERGENSYQISVKGEMSHFYFTRS